MWRFLKSVTKVQKEKKKTVEKYNKSVCFVLFFRCQEGLIWQPDDRKVSDSFFRITGGRILVVLECSGSVSEAEVQSEVSYSSDKQLKASVTHTHTHTHTHSPEHQRFCPQPHTYSSRPPSSNGATSYLGSLTTDGPISAWIMDVHTLSDQSGHYLAVGLQ